MFSRTSLSLALASSSYWFVCAEDGTQRFHWLSRHAVTQPHPEHVGYSIRFNYTYRGCIRLRVRTETRGVRSPGAGVTGDCEPPEVGAGNMLFTAELILQSQT